MTIPLLHVGRGTHRGPLTVFPIWHDFVPGGKVRLADPNSLAVSELEQPDVPFLQVQAGRGIPVLLLDGDLLLGGLQDRVAIGSTLIAPGKATTIDVRCVEADRWHGTAAHTAGARRASSFVRGDADQNGVWERVAIEQQRDATPPEIGDLRPHPGQSGVLFGIAGVPVLMEMFCHPTLLAAAWPRLLEAAARESAGSEASITTGYRAREFIGLVDQMHTIPTSGGGIGHAVSAHNGPLRLRGVTVGHRLLHASVINQRVGTS